MTEQSIGTARLDIVVDKSNAEASVAALKRTVADVGKTSDETTKKTEQNSSRQVAALKRQAETLGFTREEMVRYRIQTQTTGEAQKTLLAALDKSSARLKQQGVAFNQFGVSAKQQAAALRGVPAQLTDIFTSLASGQRPITVLLQQGGQLKDMFGGVVPAARALGGAIAGLINPVTVLGAAAVGLFVAFKQGDDEAVGFRQALALTGNAAGVTATELQAMAQAMDDGVTTQHQAAAALAEVTKSGKFTADQIRDVAEAAVALERATGQSVEQTVASFAKLKDDPVKAVVELNDKYHFLTTAVYEQIRALQAQGREEDAVNLAIRESSAQLSKRARDVVENAGFMERAWHNLGAVVRQVWDDMRDAGRASTAITDAQMKIASANSELKALEHRIRTFSANGGVYTPEREARDRREIARLVKVKQDAAKAIANDPASKAADAEANRSRATALAISLQQQADTYKTGIEKLQSARLKAEGEMEKAVLAARQAGDDRALKIAQDSGKKILSELDKQIADAKHRQEARAGSTGGGGRSGGRTRAPEPVRALPDIDSEAAARELERLAQVEAQATESFRDLEAQLQGPMAVAIRDHEKRVAELNALAAQSPEASARLSDALKLEAERHKQVADEIEAQSNPMKLLLEDMRFELDLIGKSNAERAVMIELRRQNKDAMSDEGKAALEAAKAFDEEAKGKERAIQLMDDFRGGAADALSDIVTGAKSAKEAFADFFDDLARRITQMIAEKWIEKAFGSFGTTGEGSAGGGWISAFFGALASAKGNVFQGGNVQAFANGGVVNGPTFFPMNSRLGLMGEAGPEAIVPLKRGPDGRLGVEVHGNGEPRRVMRSGDTYIQVQGAPNKQTLKQLERANGRGARREMARTGS